MLCCAGSPPYRLLCAAIQLLIASIDRLQGEQVTHAQLLSAPQFGKTSALHEMQPPVLGIGTVLLLLLVRPQLLLMLLCNLSSALTSCSVCRHQNLTSGYMEAPKRSKHSFQQSLDCLMPATYAAARSCAHKEASSTQ